MSPTPPVVVEEAAAILLDSGAAVSNPLRDYNHRGKDG